METIKIKLSRQNLIDDFKVDAQKFYTNIEIPINAIYRLEHFINTYFKEDEKFCLTVFLELTPYYSYELTRIVKNCQVKIIEIIDFDNNVLNLANKNIDIEKMFLA